MRLPVIVGMGGVNAAGRTSGFQSYRLQPLVIHPVTAYLQNKNIVH